MFQSSVAEDAASMTSSQTPSQTKRRRIPGACDICKKKKIKCDSGERMGRPCTNCELGGHECTHKSTTRSLGAAKGYVESLEMRLEKMEKVLTRFLPGVDLNTDLEHLVGGPSPDLVDTPALGSSSGSPEPSISIPRNDEEDENIAESDHLTYKLNRLRLDPGENRFFGKSSGFQLIQTALDLKREYFGYSNDPRLPFKIRKRQEYWDNAPWQRSRTDEVPSPVASEFEFPEEDLLHSLVDLYFNEINILFPLLHRPTFIRQLAEGLHQRDAMFGSTVLVVCALGAKYSNDPRVFVKGINTTRSAGQRWYAQVDCNKKSFNKKPSLYELQMHALSVFFAKSNGIHQGLWVQTGLALRMALEVGAHRRRLRKDGHRTIEDELWKRAFWTLFCIDTLMSATSGRPCFLHEEDYDQEYPAECDDEFWEHPNVSQCFQQPPQKPSTISYFTCYIRLTEMLAKVMRSVYFVRRPKPSSEYTNSKSDQQVIAELDSAMNAWMDCVPDHLRWNPNSENQLFLKQSAALHVMYYQVQIFIHRPFIPSPRNPSAITFPSLAICTNAARSCCYILDIFSRLKVMPLPHIQSIACNAALVLLVNVLNNKRFSVVPSPRRDMDLVQRVIDMLAICEQRWGSAGRFRDVLSELASVNDLWKQESNPASHGAPTNGNPPQVPLNGPLGDLYVNESVAFQNGSSIFLAHASTVDTSNSGNIGSGVALVSDTSYVLPRHSYDSGQHPAYGPFGCPQMSMAAGGSPKNEPLGDGTYLPTAMPQGNTMYTQPSQASAAGGRVFPNQNITPVMSWCGVQGADQGGSGIHTDASEQAQLMEIWEMMDIDNMGLWLTSYDLEPRWESYSIDMGLPSNAGGEGYGIP